MDNKIKIEAVIAANLTKTWDFYTNPKHIINWNFASEDWHCPYAENDKRVGGKYLAKMEAKDGSFAFDFEAIYSEIIEYKSFTYSMGTREVKVNFDAIDENQTKVIILFDPENENSLELQKNGWQSILNNFKKYVEI